MKKSQRGAELVEFALIGSIFFMLLFGVLVFGYWFHVLDTLTEAARRGARVAAVCPLGDPAIANVAVFAAANAGANAPSPLLPRLTSANVVVRYFLKNGAEVTSTGNPATDENTIYPYVRYVEVAIENYNFTANLPVLGAFGAFPRIAEALPAESLGRTSVEPDDPQRACLMPP